MVRLAKYVRLETKNKAKRIANHLSTSPGKQYKNIRVRKIKKGYAIYGKRK